MVEGYASETRRCLREYGGQELSEAGNGFLIAFEQPRSALVCATALQDLFSAAAWPHEAGGLKVRMAIHVGELERRENGEYRGILLNRASRILASAHGGQLLCSESATSVLRDVGEFVELGVYRLRGLTNPERIYQACWPSMPHRDFPPLNAPRAYASHLPKAAAQLVGRQREIAELRRTLRPRRDREEGARPDEAILTLTGVGGIGKTRLALAVAEELSEAFAGAVWFVDLSNPERDDLFLAKVLGEIGSAAVPGMKTVDSVVEVPGSRPTLLVLDGVDHCRARAVAFLDDLLPHAPATRCLVAARAALDYTSEREFPLEALPVPEEHSDSQALLECDSVRLFSDRAQSVRSSFSLTPRNAAAVADLCRELCGVPLAIELAAARIDVVAPGEMLQSLRQRFRSFEALHPEISAGERALRVVIDWSYEFLLPPLQIFLAKLSALRGEFSADAAEAVAASCELMKVSGSGLRALLELRSTGLVAAEEHDGVMRFRLPEPVRQHAAERFARRADGAER